MIIRLVQINIAVKQKTMPEKQLISGIPEKEKCLQENPIGILNYGNQPIKLRSITWTLMELVLYLLYVIKPENVARVLKVS